MLAGLISDELGSESDVEVRMQDPQRALPEVLDEFLPNVVITNSTGGTVAAEIRQLLEDRPEVLVVGVEAQDDRHPAMLFVEGATLSLGELVPGKLLHALRSYAARH
jgi:hypothetical protein